MKSFSRKFTAFALAFILVLYPINVYAATSEETLSETEYAGKFVTEIMRIILEKYYGDTNVDSLLDGALRGMFDTLDEYSEYFSPSGYDDFSVSLQDEAKGFGFMFGVEAGGLRILRVYEGSPAAKANMREDDLITEVNGLKLANRSQADITTIMQTATDKTSAFKLTRGDKVIDLTMTPTVFNASSVWLRTIEKAFAGHTLTGDYSKARFVSINSISETSAADFRTAMEQMKKDGVTRIILDLRGNGGGYVDQAVEICKQLVKKGTIITQIFANGEKVVHSSSLSEKPFEKILVLTDGGTASAAEIIASALQDDGATVIGQKSYGKGVIQVLYSFTEGGGFKITNAEYLRRSGAKLDKIGVTPNTVINVPSFLEELKSTKPSDVSAEYVKRLTASLKFIGIAIGNPDTYNEEVITAVKALQKRNGITETGELDNATLDTLNGTVFNYYFNGTATEAAAIKALLQ